MSDDRVRAAVEQMEAWLAEPTWEPNPEALDQWNSAFLAAAAAAEKAPGWADLVERAHAAGRLLDDRIRVLAAARDQVRAEIEAQGLGNRALRGYGATTR